MFKSCPVCNGWGLAKDEIGFSMVKCPACEGKCIVDEETLRPVEHIESEGKNQKDIYGGGDGRIPSNIKR